MLFARILYKPCALCKNTSRLYREVENMRVGQNLAMRSVALILSTVIAVPMIPLMSGKKSVYAGDIVKTMSNTRYGTQIAAPLNPKTKDSEWRGNYVWFGYLGKYLKFRVLDPKTTKYGGETVFLQSDEGLYSSIMANRQTQWSNSDLRKDLNADFLENTFTDAEKDAIAMSKFNGGEEYSYDTFEYEAFDETVAVDDKIFLLDADEVMNPKYGYYHDHGWETQTDWRHCTGTHKVLNHVMKNRSGNKCRYWLRSYSKWHEQQMGYININGMMDIEQQNCNYGVVPALNLSRKNILLTTELKPADADGAGAEYKLTILSKRLKVEIPNTQPVTFAGKTVCVPYALSGSESGLVSQLSVMILDRPYSQGNTNGAKMLSYMKMDGVDGYNGTGVFTLPSELDILDWGKKYFVYIFAESFYTTHASDAASMPVEICIDSVRFDFTTDGEVECDSIHEEALEALVQKGLITRKISGGSLYWYDVDGDGKFDFHAEDGLGLYLPVTHASIKGTYIFTDEQLTGTGFSSIVFIFTVEKSSTVTGLKAVSAGKNKVKLTWNPSEGAEGYLIYAQKNNKYAYVGMTTRGTTFTDTKALDTDYNYYWVFGYNKDYYGNMIPGGCEKYVFAKGVCMAVTGLKAASVSGGVKLTWNASTDAEGYLVYGIHPGGSYGYIGMTTMGTTFTDKKASKTDWNFYWVYPYHKNGSTMVVGGTPKYVYGKAR